MIFIEIVGWIGTGLLVLAYALLTMKKISSTSWQYQTMNAVGALALVVNSLTHGAIPVATLNGIWFVIGALGLLAIVRATNKKKQTASPDEQ